MTRTTADSDVITRRALAIATAVKVPAVAYGRAGRMHDPRLRVAASLDVVTNGVAATLSLLQGHARSEAPRTARARGEPPRARHIFIEFLPEIANAPHCS